MPMRDLQHYVALVDAGDDTVPERLDMLIEHRDTIRRRIRELTLSLAATEYKIATYGGTTGPDVTVGPEPPGKAVPASGRPSRSNGQLSVSAVSSTQNDVCRDESSVPVKVSVTVCPANAETSTVRSW
jgi:hypothetical protein